MSKLKIWNEQKYEGKQIQGSGVKQVLISLFAELKPAGQK
jgi:hypothetical protein